MFYSIKKLTIKLKRSAGFIKLCIDRFGIKQTRFKTTGEIAYDISKEKMQEIINYSNRRKKVEYKNRNRKNDK